MHISHSNTMPLPRTEPNGECGEPLAMSHTIDGYHTATPGEMAFMNKLVEDSEAMLKKQVEEYVVELLASVTSETLERNGRFQLVVANETMAGIVHSLLAERGHDNIDVVVAAALPTAKTREEDYWTPKMMAGKEAAYRAQQPRHSSTYTKAQPTAKARKAARKRAKAGRRASR